MRTALVLLLTAAVASLPAQLTTRQQAKKDAALGKELQSGWDRWLKEDVALIITDDERKAFGQLGTDDEREQFVEQFWLRRDPTPETIENEYKEEHYRRIAYANQHFASGIAGRQTDRGRIYIRFGPPDEIDSHPSGGSYQRTAAEGGGQTSTYPFEQWRYRHIDDIGEDIVIEFVDMTMTGEYRMTIDPCAKDALQHVPGAAPTLTEQIGLSTQAARFQNTDGTTCGAPLGGKSANDNQFTRLERQAKLEHAPAIKFKDLETVTSHISYNMLPMRVEVDYLRATSFSALANVTLEFDNRDLQFLAKDGLGKSTVELVGQVFTMTGRRVTAFDRSIEATVPAAMVSELARQRTLWQQSLPLAPGRYKMVVVARDKVSGNVGSYESALDVPRFEDDRAGAGSLILADAIEGLPSRSIGGALFAIGDTRVRPRVSRQFTVTEKMGIYLQLYNLPPGGEIAWQVERADNSGRALEYSEKLPAASGTQIAIARMLPLTALPPGSYRLKLTATGGDAAIERKADFTVVP